MPMSPLESTASAIAAHAAIIQRRRESEPSGAPSAIRNAQSVAVVQRVSPMSSVTIPPRAMK